MKRISAGIVVLCFLTVSSGLAQGRQPSEPASPATGKATGVTYDFSAKAAGIDRIAAEKAAPGTRESAARTTRAPKSSAASNSFWHSPWPYVIIACAVVAGVIVASKSGDGTGY